MASHIKNVSQSLLIWETKNTLLKRLALKKPNIVQPQTQLRRQTTNIHRLKSIDSRNDLRLKSGLWVPFYKFTLAYWCSILVYLRKYNSHCGTKCVGNETGWNTSLRRSTSGWNSLKWTFQRWQRPSRTFYCVPWYTDKLSTFVRTLRSISAATKPYASPNAPTDALLWSYGKCKYRLK